MTHKYNDLGIRMKNYEQVSSSKLMRRTPVIIRLDGKAFHTFTKQFNSDVDSSLIDNPFSHKLHVCMTETTKFLVENIQNARFGYTQSDEITILLTDWTNLNTDQWFNGSIQKIASVSASMATAKFNQMIKQEVNLESLAFFDSRTFNLPISEVANNLLWRQQDATRNSIQMLGHYHFSQSQLYKKNTSEIQAMLLVEKDINWNNIETWKKRGTCVYKDPTSGEFIIDEEMPIITQDRNYIERFLA
jgi:tRNA(His) guanylyltransferase